MRSKFLRLGAVLFASLTQLCLLALVGRSRPSGFLGTNCYIGPVPTDRNNPVTPESGLTGLTWQFEQAITTAKKRGSGAGTGREVGDVGRPTSAAVHQFPSLA